MDFVLYIHVFTCSNKITYQVLQIRICLASFTQSLDLVVNTNPIRFDFKNYI